MNSRAKQKVLLLYGGRSTEHAVSCRSAAFILRNLDSALYDVASIAIDADGRWICQDTRALYSSLADTNVRSVPIQSSRDPSDRRLFGEVKDIPSSQSVILSTFAQRLPGESAGNLPLSAERLDPSQTAIDASAHDLPVVIPMLHGSFGEDGTLQGMLELMGLPYVGSDHLGSAIGMDKVVAKRLAKASGLPVVPWVDVRSVQYDPEVLSAEVARLLTFPVFVKPASSGSSVGVVKVDTVAELPAAGAEAFKYDNKILIEKAVVGREIECAVLGGPGRIEVSVPGEVAPKTGFYSYKAKYQDAEAADLLIPAPLQDDQVKTAQALCRATFEHLELYGLARIDLFLETHSGEFYLNEVNTMPGFTAISQYPLLWEASGLAPGDLLSKLIKLALERHESRRQLVRKFDHSNIT